MRCSAPTPLWGLAIRCIGTEVKPRRPAPALSLRLRNACAPALPSLREPSDPQARARLRLTGHQAQRRLLGSERPLAHPRCTQQLPRHCLLSSSKKSDVISRAAAAAAIRSWIIFKIIRPVAHAVAHAPAASHPRTPPDGTVDGSADGSVHGGPSVVFASEKCPPRLRGRHALFSAKSETRDGRGEHRSSDRP